MSSHLKLRHKYDYDTYTVPIIFFSQIYITFPSKDYDKEDDAILRQVMEQSKSLASQSNSQSFPIAESAFGQAQDAEDEIMRQILELSKHEK